MDISSHSGSSDWHHLRAFIALHVNQDLALATIIAVEGSSYRKPGARLLVNAAGHYAGSLSGGCLENGVAKVAQQVLQDGNIRTETIDTKPHFGCPGILTILIEKISADGLLDVMIHKLGQREVFHLTTPPEGTQLGKSNQPDHFTESIPPRPRLIVVGWTSDQDPLFQMASVLDWECIRVVKDDKIAAATAVIANEEIIICTGNDLSKTFPPDPHTAVLIMSHHMATDLAFLASAAKVNYPYTGLLGSRRRREKLLAELGELGLLEQLGWTENFHAPVGLDIGAAHPSTIALSILAEIQATFTKTSGLPMSQTCNTNNAVETC